MYGWLWRHLPGPVVVRLAIALVLVAGLLLGLFWWVFPWVETTFGGGDVTVTSPPLPFDRVSPR